MPILKIRKDTATSIADAIRARGVNVSPNLQGQNFASNILSIPSAASDIYMIYDGENYQAGVDPKFNSAYSLSSNCTQGSKSLALTANEPLQDSSIAKVGGMLVMDLNHSIDINKYDYVMFDVYVNQSLGSQGGQIQLNFVTEDPSNASLQDGFNWTLQTPSKPGWNRFVTKKSSIAKTVAVADWSNIYRLRLTWFNLSQITNTPTILLDNVVAYNR